jgi:PAS domain S-box-containing protein
MDMPDTSGTNRDRLIDALLDGVFICTKSGEITFANPAFAQMLRYSQEEILSRNFPRDLVSKDLEWRALASLLDQGSPICDYEIRLRRADGYEICMAISALNLRGDKGEHTGIAGVARDISTRKAIERELREKAFRADALSRIAATAATNRDIRKTFPALASELGKAVPFEGISVSIGPEESGHGALRRQHRELLHFQPRCGDH